MGGVPPLIEGGERGGREREREGERERGKGREEGRGRKRLKKEVFFISCMVKVAPLSLNPFTNHINNSNANNTTSVVQLSKQLFSVTR